MKRLTRHAISATFGSHGVAGLLRDFWMIFTTALALIGVWVAIGASSDAETAATKARTSASDSAQSIRLVQEGRRIGIAALCASISALAEAGYVTIAGGAQIKPREFERFLENGGLPPGPLRAKASQLAATAYVEKISELVEREAAITGFVRIVRHRTRDASGKRSTVTTVKVACDKLAKASFLRRQPAPAPGRTGSQP